jgi:hypothetical protein
MYIYAVCWAVVTGVQYGPSHSDKQTGTLHVQCTAWAVVFVHGTCDSSDTLRV